MRSKRIKQTLVLLSCVVFLVKMPSQALASPVQWRIEDGGNGHYYELLPEETGLSWEEAKQQAEAKVSMGTNG